MKKTSLDIRVVINGIENVSYSRIEEALNYYFGIDATVTVSEISDEPKETKEGYVNTRNFGKWKKKELSERIMSYDANQIHEACLGCGHPTDWEFFDKELKTYSWQDMRNLAQELQDQFGDPGQGEGQP